MAAQAPMTVLTRGTVNGAATANVIYQPMMASQKDANGYLVSAYQERGAATPLGYSDLVIRSKPAAGNLAIQRLNMKLVIPTLETLSTSSVSGYVSAPSVAYTNEAGLSAMLPTRGTPAEKWELHARMVSAFSNAVILALFKDNEQIS